MSACAAEIEGSNVVEVTPRIPGRDLSWINALFQQWGEWIWERRDEEGYPTSDSVHAFVYGAGGSSYASKVLYKDFPEGRRGDNLRLIHATWLMLPEHEGIAMYAEYVPGIREDGTAWTRAEKCQAIGISEEGFRKRLQRAKIRVWQWGRKPRRN